MPLVIDIEGQGRLAIPFDATMKVADLAAKIKQRKKILSDIVLFFDKSELCVEDTLKDLTITDNCIIHVKCSEARVAPSPPIVQSDLQLMYKTVQGAVKKFPVSVGTTLEDLKQMFVKLEGVNDGDCLILLEKIPLFYNDESKKLPIERFDVRNGDFLYPFFLSLDKWADRYTISSTVDDVYRDSPFWRPSVAQTTLAQSIFLCSLNALKMHFMTPEELHGYPQLFSWLHKWLSFPPALLAMKHLQEGEIMQYEKAVIAESLYALFRSLLPESVPNDSVFQHAPEIWGFIINSLDVLEIPMESWEEIDLRNHLSPEGKRIKVAARLRVGPHRIYDRETLVGIADDSRQNICGTQYDNSQVDPIPDITCLLDVLKEVDPNEVVTSYLISSTNSNPLSWKAPTRFSTGVFSSVVALLRRKPHLHKFVFLPGAKLSKNSIVLSIDVDNRCVHILEQLKSNRNYKIFNPMEPQNTECSVDGLLAKDKFQALNLPVPETVVKDTRPIEQTTIVVFDVSGSMDSPVFKSDKSLSRYDCSKAFFGALVDKTVVLHYPHQIGLVTFGNDVSVPFPISRDFEEFSRLFGQSKNVQGSTKLWDGIKRAGELLVEARDQGVDFAKNAIFRVLCLTDGEDNASVLKPLEVAQFLQKERIVLDALPVGDCNHKDLRAVANATGGLCFTVQSYALGIELFESEATICLQERELSPKNKELQSAQELEAYGKIETYPECSRPERKRPKSLEKKSVESKKAQFPEMTFSKSSRMKRIASELQKWKRDPLPQFRVFINEDDITCWKLLFCGEVGTPYVGGLWLLYIFFPETYPISPPEIRFETKIFHCNINNDGKICHQVITTKWSQNTAVRTILEYVADLLREPNPDDALDAVKGQLRRENPEGYVEAIKEWVAKYASATEEQLKQKYNIHD